MPRLTVVSAVAEIRPSLGIAEAQIIYTLGLGYARESVKPDSTEQIDLLAVAECRRPACMDAVRADSQFAASPDTDKIGS